MKWQNFEKQRLTDNFSKPCNTHNIVVYVHESVKRHHIEYVAHMLIDVEISILHYKVIPYGISIVQKDYYYARVLSGRSVSQYCSDWYQKSSSGCGLWSCVSCQY